VADLVGDQVADVFSLFGPRPDVAGGDVEEGDFAEVDQVSRRPAESPKAFIIRKPGGEFRPKNRFQTLIVVARPRHDGEVAQQKQAFPVLPGPDRVEGVLTEDEVEFEVFEPVFVQDVLHRLHGVGGDLAPVFHIGEGEGGVPLDGESDHLLAVVEGCDCGVEFVRRPRRRNEDDPVQIENLQHFRCAPQMSDMDRIKRTPEQSPFHVLTCPFP
jgi:hypothetical protein